MNTTPRDDTGEPKRYDIYMHSDDVQFLRQCPDGDYVRWLDYSALQAERTSLLSRLEAAEANARRYVWLREGDNDELVLRVFGADDKTPSRPFNIAIDYCYLPRGDSLDAAIDARLSGMHGNHYPACGVFGGDAHKRGRDVCDCGTANDPDETARLWHKYSLPDRSGASIGYTQFKHLIEEVAALACAKPGEPE